MKIVCVRDTLGYNFSKVDIMFKEGNVYWYTSNCRHLILKGWYFSLYNTDSYQNGFEGYLMEDNILFYIDC